MNTQLEQTLAAARELHIAEPAIQDFCQFPDAIKPVQVSPHHIPAADLFTSDASLAAPPGYQNLVNSLRAISPQMNWRETYQGTPLAEEFYNRFACYEFLGDGGPFQCEGMRGFIVYMPSHLWYPFHYHPSEELYFILAGEAEFRIEGEAPKTLRAGDAVYHPSGVHHATETKDSPFLAWVLWRGPDFVTPPLLSEGLDR